jgi:hypothetical protein
MPHDPICYKRRIGQDEMRCTVCRLTWDIDDPNPPACGKVLRVRPVPPERLPFASGLPFVDNPQRR